MKDMLGQEIQIGDIVAWCRGGSKSGIRQCVGVIENIKTSCVAKVIKSSYYYDQSGEKFTIGRSDSIIVINEQTKDYVLKTKLVTNV